MVPVLLSQKIENSNINFVVTELDTFRSRCSISKNIFWSQVYGTDSRNQSATKCRVYNNRDFIEKCANYKF